jgi:anti-sigma B factor antagonist
MPETPARLTITDVDESTISIAGEIDAHTAPQLAEHFATLPGGGDIVLQMAGVGFIDSSGLRVLIELHQRAEEESRRLVLSAPSSSVVRLVEIAGLADYVHIVS